LIDFSLILASFFFFSGAHQLSHTKHTHTTLTNEKGDEGFPSILIGFLILGLENAWTKDNNTQNAKPKFRNNKPN